MIGLGNTELGAHDVGNDVPRTRIWKTPSGYRLEGRKYYATGTLYADFVLVRAADDASRLASVIIPTKRTGVDIVDDWAGTGQRLTASGTANFNNVAVDEDEVVLDTPDVGYGLTYANTQAQLYLTAINAGIIRAVLRDATQTMTTRKRTFYHAPSITKTDPLLLAVIGRIHAHAFAAEAAVLAAADKLDEISRIRDTDGDDMEAAHEASLAAASAKIVVDTLAIESGSLVFDVGGASVATAQHNLDRHWRNARTLASHNPGAYKTAAIGAYHVNATPLPRGSFF